MLDHSCRLEVDQEQPRQSREYTQKERKYYSKSREEERIYKLGPHCEVEEIKYHHDHLVEFESYFQIKIDKKSGQMTSPQKSSAGTTSAEQMHNMPASVWRGGSKK